MKYFKTVGQLKAALESYNDNINLDLLLEGKVQDFYIDENNASDSISIDITDGSGKYKLKRAALLYWVYDGKDNLKNLGKEVLDALSVTGKYVIDAEEVLDDCIYIPDYICEWCVAEGRKFKPSECVLID